MKKWLFMKRKTVIIGALALFLACLLSSCSANLPKIDLDDYVILTFDGYDGYGTVSVRLDGEAITADYGKKVKAASKKTDQAILMNLFDFTVGEVISESTNVCAETASGLSNGDTVTLNWDVDTSLIAECYNCEVSYGNRSFPVEGLEEIGTTDIFQGLEVYFTGYSPAGDIQISAHDNPYYNDYYGTFYANGGGSFANGDEVAVMYDYTAGSSAFLAQYGVLPESWEKTYTVSVLDSYIEDFSDFSEENIAALEAEALDQAEAKFASEDAVYFGIDIDGKVSYSWKKGDDFRLDNVYFRKAKSYSSWSNLSYSAPVFVYSVSMTNSDSNRTERIYFAISFNNLLMEENGSLVGISDHQVKKYTSLDDAYQEWVTEMKDQYTIDIYDTDLNKQQ